jgi:hypothetical protein
MELFERYLFVICLLFALIFDFVDAARNLRALK